MGKRRKEEWEEGATEDELKESVSTSELPRGLVRNTTIARQKDLLGTGSNDDAVRLLLTSSPNRDDRIPTSEDFLLTLSPRQAALQATNQVSTSPTQVAHAGFVLMPSDVNGSKNTYSVPII